MATKPNFLVYWICAFLVVLFYFEIHQIWYIYRHMSKMSYKTKNHNEDSLSMFENVLINSSNSQCQIPNIAIHNSFNMKYYKKHPYYSCTKNPLLTFVTKDNESTFKLYVKEELFPLYSSTAVRCCVSNVTRHNSNKIMISKCIYFEKEFQLKEEIIKVKCRETKIHTVVYENVHTFIPKRKASEKNSNNTQIPSVLIIGIDSISRLNFLRLMPNTSDFLEENGWISYNGYNKVADNTFPNVMAFLTGYNETRSKKVCKSTIKDDMSKCPSMWNFYRKFGYRTAYAEDLLWISTFNFMQTGLRDPPIDYNFRLYIKATETLKTFWDYCSGPEPTGERMLNLVTNFTEATQDLPTFGFFWMNSFSHWYLNTPSRMDQKVKKMLERLKETQVTNTSIIIFLSDHGIRFGNYRLTFPGWLEERLPFLYFSIPDWFQTRFPKEFSNLKLNANRLTTPYDLFMTLQYILVLSGHNHSTEPSEACPNCHSLFKEINETRSCQEAGISPHWCTCLSYQPIKKDSSMTMEVANFVIEEIENLFKINFKDKCAKYKLVEVTKAYVSKDFKKAAFVLVTFKTIPEAIFEATIKMKYGRFSLVGGISRLDIYGKNKCLGDSFLQKYCTCNTTNEKNIIL